jgi:hypothetical protein
LADFFTAAAAPLPACCTAAIRAEPHGPGRFQAWQHGNHFAPFISKMQHYTDLFWGSGLGHLHIHSSGLHSKFSASSTFVALTGGCQTY